MVQVEFLDTDFLSFIETGFKFGKNWSFCSHTQVLCSYRVSGLLLMGLIGFTFLKVGLSSSRSFVIIKLYNFLLLRFSDCKFLMCHN